MVTLWTGFKLTANAILADSCPCSSEKRNTGIVSCEWNHASLVWQDRDMGVVVSTNIFLPLYEMVGLRTHMWAGVLTSEVLVWNKLLFWINACYLITHLCQNQISNGMQKNLIFLFFSVPTLAPICCRSAPLYWLSYPKVVLMGCYLAVAWTVSGCIWWWISQLCGTLFARRISAICFQQIWSDTVFWGMSWYNYVAVLKYDAKTVWQYLS